MALSDLWKKLLPDWTKWRPSADWLWPLVGGLIGVLIAWGLAVFFEGQGSYPVLKLFMVFTGGATGGAVVEAWRKKNKSLATIYAAIGGGLILGFGCLMWLLRAIGWIFS